MSGYMRGLKPNSYRISSNKRKWQRKEELALIAFLKENTDFEKPCARIYYTKFLFENRIDNNWKLVRCKVRNMRTTYRKAKELEMNKADSSYCNIDDLKKQVIKICWFVDDFDIIFPNTTDNCVDKHYDPIFDDEFSKDESLCNVNKSSKSFKINFLPEEESTISSLSKSGADGDSIVIKEEKIDEDTNITQKSSGKVENKLNYGKDNFHPVESRLKEWTAVTEKTPFRNRPNPIRKWQRNEEVALIDYLKENRDFEQPTARTYYTQFLFESGIDADWHHARNKVRNMRVSYRKAKEYEIKEVDSKNCNIQSVRNQILNICWYLDDFDDIFPNEMDNSAYLQIYKNPDPISDDGLSKEEPFNNLENTNKNVNSNLLLEEDSTSSLSNSLDGSIFAVHKNLVNLKKQKRAEDISLKQQELELAKEKLNFEKEKFRQEIRLREKEIENEEKLKVMEFQMKERIAIKKLEVEEMMALRSAKKPENSYNTIYHNNI